MYYKLFLDDIRKVKDVTWIELPLGPWLIARSYKEFISLIQEHGLPSFISFDHDLAFEHYPFSEDNPRLRIPYETYKEKTGYDAAKWIVDFCLEKNLELPEFSVHSLNPIGADNIYGIFASAKRFIDKEKFRGKIGEE